MTRTFYCFMAWLMDFGATIARSTGRDPDEVQLLEDSARNYEKKLFQEDNDLFDTTGEVK